VKLLFPKYECTFFKNLKSFGSINEFCYNKKCEYILEIDANSYTEKIEFISIRFLIFIKIKN
jgi:hypothetical protein